MTTENNSQNRRRFSRIEFDAACRLKVGEALYPVRLHDISFKGALVTLTDEVDLASAPEPVQLEILLAGHEQKIFMTCKFAHREQQHVGLRCTHIDLDSASHLRRLVELNLGDSDLLDRELAGLVPGE